ncbi:AraC family transcriptional regulator [Lysinibacillus boronitolerans]|uniref:helix-turn-helix domain-containing protein n=1 Tax=Lysinibacillus boronitolerans TaxID=309788 RepID=UPI0021616953|nr:helix-turn-helix domain-containing protein [Lysinibacillus boronitolerans]MCS1391223.1 AraC family transcriptional regulator [Lysinibacillus boronitolerans]
MKTESRTDTTTQISLKDIRDYIAKNHHQPLTIEHLALISGLSSSYFGEAFKKAFDQSATDYLTALRIGHAKQLLRDTDLLLREIARKVGYSDEFYFSRKFKKEVGITPSAYSKMARKRISTFSVSTTGNLLALGILPVAAPLDAKWSPYYYNHYHEKIPVHVNIFDAESEDNFKKLASAKPDIHIFQEEPSLSMLDWLQTIGIENVYIQAKDWRTQLREIAIAVKKQSVGEHFIQSYEQKVLEAKQEIKRATKEDSFAVLRLCGDQLFLYCNKGIQDVLFTDLQLRPINAQQQTYNEHITLDQLVNLNPDRLLFIICPDSPTRHYWLTLQYLDRWKELRAVKNGHVYVLPSNPWFEYSAIAINRMLDEMLLMLTGKNPNPFPVPVHGNVSDGDL